MDGEDRREDPGVVLHRQRAPVDERQPKAPAQGRRRSGQEADGSRPGDAHARGERADGNVQSGEVPVEEGALGAEEERGCEERAGPRALAAEHRQPVREQGAEEEAGQSPRLRIRQEAQGAGEEQVRDGEEELGEAGMLEVVRPVPLGRADGGEGIAHEEDEPLLVALRRLEVIALVAHESDRSGGGEERDEDRASDGERQAPAHPSLTQAATQNGRSVSRDVAAISYR